MEIHIFRKKITEIRSTKIFALPTKYYDYATFMHINQTTDFYTYICTYRVH